jgi:hypothetical protein
MTPSDLDPAKGVIHCVATAVAIWMVIGLVMWMVWG